MLSHCTVDVFMYLFISTCSTEELRLHQQLHMEFKNLFWQFISFINHLAFCNLITFNGSVLLHWECNFHLKKYIANIVFFLLEKSRL